VRYDSKLSQFDSKKISNIMPNKGHVGVFILTCAYVSDLEEGKCEKDIKGDISSNGNNTNLGVLGKFCTESTRSMKLNVCLP